MAITQSDSLHIRKGNATYLLLRSPTHFHLIRTDTGLSESKMARLFRVYPCDEDRLRELGVHFSAFKANNLRRIVIRGYQAGDTLELWLRGDVRKYQLGADYSDETLANFFSGILIARQLPPEWNGLDPNLIRKVTKIVNATSTVCALAFCFIRTPYRLWSILCVLCQLSAVALALFYPSSFVLAEESKPHKNYIHRGKGHLLSACTASGLALSLRALTDFTFTDRSLGRLLLAILIASFLLYVVYIRINKELYKGLLHAIGVLLTIVLCTLGTVGQLNYLLDFNRTDRQIVPVVDKQMDTSGKGTDYDCTVLLPTGESMELSLPGRLYRDIEIGDDVLVIHHDGAFHIPFSTVETLPDSYEMW